MRKREWGVIQTRLASEERERREMLDTMEQHRRDFDAALRAGLTGRDVRLVADYVTAQRSRVRAADQQIAGTRRRLEAKLVEVLMATRERKAMDIVRQRFIARRDYEERHEEDKTLTEMALNRYVRKQGEESNP